MQSKKEKKIRSSILMRKCNVEKETQTSSEWKRPAIIAQKGGVGYDV